MNILRFEKLPVRPWKNGGGTVRVIAERSAPGSPAECDWYVAIADIEQLGPFSPYPGMDRRLIHLQGSPLALRCRSQSQGLDFTHRIDTPLTEFAFQGDWDTSCESLASPADPSAPKLARVLNVITRRSHASARIEVIEVSTAQPVEKAPGESLLIVVAAGSLRAMSAGANVQPPLARYDVLLEETPGYASVSLSPAGFGAAHAVVVRIISIRAANS